MEVRPKIVIAEPDRFSPLGLKKLQDLGTVVLGPFSKNELIATCEDATVLILRLAHTIDFHVLQKAKNLKYIVTPTTGLNHIDIKTATLKKIEIISLKGETAFLRSIPSTAEHTWGLLLALVRNIPQAHNHVMEGKWNRDAFVGRNLGALKLGILGMGRVGNQMAKFADAFGMEYVFYDIDAGLNDNPSNAKDLDSFLISIDVLTVHIPLEKETTKFLNAEMLSKLKRGSLIVNTSRGEIVDEVALVKLLMDGHISGVAVDVLDQELIKEKREQNGLLRYAKTNSNVIITPHIAGATIDSMQATEDFVVNKLIERWQ